MDIQTAFKQQFIKHLDSLAAEVKAYRNEKDLWLIRGEVLNTAGNLALHLLGNLQHFIGAQLGHTGYVRQRDKEFSDKDVPVTLILEQLEHTRQVLEKTFDGLSSSDLEKTFPLENFGAGKTVYEVLLILLAHLNYHLGQINYHRRMI